MNLRNFAIWALIGVVLLGVYELVSGGKPGAATPAEVGYSDILKRIDDGNIKSAILKPGSIEAVQTDNSHLVVNTPMDQSDLTKRLEAHGEARGCVRSEPGAGRAGRQQEELRR